MMTLIAAMALQAPAIVALPRGYRTVTVVRVKDGDTFEIAERWAPFKHLPWSIRVRGLDTPELSSKCPGEVALAKAAKGYVKHLIATRGAKVRVRNVTHDKYGGRMNADVTLADGSKFDVLVIKAGVARPYFGGKRSDWCKL